MDFMNDFWFDQSAQFRGSMPSLELDAEDLSIPALPLDSSGYDLEFDLDRFDEKDVDECLRAIHGPSDPQEFDCESLESSIFSEGSNCSMVDSLSPRSMEDSKTPYSDATQCRRPFNGHIRRPMNPFMVFAKEERRRMSALSPTLHNAEISKICGCKWKNMTVEEKKPYVLESARLKLLHEKEYPDYKYKPRKKSNKPSGKKIRPFVSLEMPVSGRQCKQSVSASRRTKQKEQPLKMSTEWNTVPSAEIRKSFLLVNGHKVPLKTAKSSDNKSTMNLQLKIDKNYKIVPATATAKLSPAIQQSLPPVSEFGSSFKPLTIKKEEIYPDFETPKKFSPTIHQMLNPLSEFGSPVAIKQEEISMSQPVFVSFPSPTYASDFSFSPIFVGSNGTTTQNEVYVLINYPPSPTLSTDALKLEDMY